MTCPLITLTTDFGTADPYVGIMKGVVLALNPNARIVDITHDVRPQAILQGSFLIGKSYRHFPNGSIHVVVVDPGVGTDRRPLLLLTPEAAFVAPDNGVLSHVVSRGSSTPSAGLPQDYKAYSLTNPDFWLHPVSNTFHGRDIFAPVAAHLSLGVEPQRLGEPMNALTLLDISPLRWKRDVLEGRIVHVDRFGNLVTDIEAEILGQGEGLEIAVGSTRIPGLSSSYAEGGSLMGIIGSFGTLEIAARDSSAAVALGADLGDAVRVFRRPPAR